MNESFLNIAQNFILLLKFFLSNKRGTPEYDSSIIQI